MCVVTVNLHCSLAEEVQNLHSLDTWEGLLTKVTARRELLQKALTTYSAPIIWVLLLT